MAALKMKGSPDSYTVYEKFLPSDGGRKSFGLDRSSGKKTLVLSARELTICWGDTPDYWQWISVPESRFSEIALLVSVCWLDIYGKIDCRMLSEETSYTAHLIFKVTEDSYGLGVPQKAVVKLGASTSEKTVCLHPSRSQRRRWRRRQAHLGNERAYRRRADGWTEVELGQFFCNDGGDGEVEFSLKETVDMCWKHGLLVEGIEVRPVG